MNINRSRKAIVLSLVFMFTLGIHTANGKSFLQSYSLQDEYIISVNNVVMNGELTLRGLTADFPFPIMSTISVLDSQANIVFGLADTLRWLGAADTAEIGKPIMDIWHPLMEYDMHNQAATPDSDLYNQYPKALVTEVRESMPLPTSTMLVMDVTWSMNEELEAAKIGLLLYVDLLRSVDRCGIIQFSDSVESIIEMTTDTSALKADIRRARPSGKTALYDALMVAVAGISKETGRRGIIVYTDGKDNLSDSTRDYPREIIDSANVLNLPIFTIALGEDTQENELKQIADETGGIFFKAATAEEMQQIYARLSDVMQNYYVLAHCSPDPGRDKSWRLIDVTVDIDDKKGRGIGRYYFDGPPAYLLADMAVDLASATDTTLEIAGDTINAIHPGSAYDYQIKLDNLGPFIADTVKLVHRLPDSVRYLEASLPPQSANDDSLVWEFFKYYPDNEITISVSVQHEDLLPLQLTDLFSEAQVTANNDTVPGNNYASEMVKAWVKPPPPVYDLSLTQEVSTDTTIKHEGNIVRAVLLGHSYDYRLTIKNSGPETAKDITLWDAIPDSVLFFGFSHQPLTMTSDTVFWKFDSLTSGDTLSISFEAAAIAELPFTPFPLVNNSAVDAQYDTAKANNFASTTIYVIPNPKGKLVDVAVRQVAATDSVAIVGGDTLRFVRKGEVYRYTLTVTNLSTLVAKDVVVTDLLPDLIATDNFEPTPTVNTGDSLVWTFAALQPRTSAEIAFDATVPGEMPIGKNLLINFVKVSASNEDPALLANNVDIDTVYNLVKPPSDWLPFIEATPPKVEVGADISVRVQTTVPIQTWDLWVRFANGQIDSSYADDFIDVTVLESNTWVNIEPLYNVTQMRTEAGQEPMVFELRAKDAFGVLKSVRASVTVIRIDDFYVNRNVFIPEQDNNLIIRFKIKSRRFGQLDLWDITGTKITTLTEANFNAGWNAYTWNGLTEDGQKVGSGFYIITLQADGINAWKKLMIVR